MSSFKAHEKRKKTLLVEYKNQFKSNKFTDKRIGENDTNLSVEDKMFKRFVAQRQKKQRVKKSSKYNLNNADDEDEDGSAANNQVDLTHFGQSLAQIEKFEKMYSSDETDEEDPNRGKINPDIVSQNFFGGFSDNNDENKKKSRKEWIEEMIMKSKQLKYERQKERDKTLDLTEQLDKEWKNIIPLIGSMNKKLKDRETELSREQTEDTKPDDYDVLVKKLQFDPKGLPTDKTKTPEEIKKLKDEELEKQQNEMLERMNKEIEVEQEDEKRTRIGLKKAPANHYSVDDMEFNDPEYVQMRMAEEIKQKNKMLNEEEQKALREQKKADDNNEDEEDEEANESDENGQDEEDESDDQGGDDDDDEEDEEDVDDEGESSSSDDNETESKSSIKSDDDKTTSKDKWLHQFHAICSKLNSNSINLGQFKKMIDSLIEQLDPSRDEGNKGRLCELTKHLINYYQFVLYAAGSNKKVDFNLIKLLTKFIYDLTFKYGNKSTKKEPSPYVEMFKEILKNLNEDYLRKKSKKFPHLNILFTFKLIQNVFPTSDYRHQVVTPCLFIMTRYLTECRINSVGDLFRGLFICHLCHEFVAKSKRFIPECLQYLTSVLYKAIDLKSLKEELAKNNYHTSTIYETFKKSNINLFPSNGKIEKLKELNLIEMCFDETQDQISDQIKSSLVAYTLDLLKAFVQLNESIVSFRELFYFCDFLLGHLPVEKYPNEIKKRIENLKNLIEKTSDQPKEHLKCLLKKPIPNKLHEPKVESKAKFDPRHHNTMISEKQLLNKKYKKELKSAIKEIRQDNQFLARVRLEEQLEKDAKRSKKVKEIMSSLSTQEGEFQKIKRQKT